MATLRRSCNKDNLFNIGNEFLQIFFSYFEYCANSLFLMGLYNGIAAFHGLGNGICLQNKYYFWKVKALWKIIPQIAYLVSQVLLYSEFLYVIFLK